MHRVETIVEVTSFEVVRFARDLRASHVVDIAMGDRKLIDRVFKGHGLAVIQHDHPESVGRVVLIASTTHRVHDKVIILAAASDEDIHGRNIVTG